MCHTCQHKGNYTFPFTLTLYSYRYEKAHVQLHGNFIVHWLRQNERELCSSSNYPVQGRMKERISIVSLVALLSNRDFSELKSYTNISSNIHDSSHPSMLPSKAYKEANMNYKLVIITSVSDLILSTFPGQSLSKTLEEAMDLSQDRLILDLRFPLPCNCHT
jgi:hypothetical protein